jgi:hypothetical protein
MKNGLKQLCFFLLIVSAMSCSNIFVGGARKTLDAAKFVEAKIKINNRDWQGAIDTLESMTTRYRTRRDVKFLLSSAYAGLCGLDFLALAQRLSNAGGSSNLFEMTLALAAGGTQEELDACKTAEETINGISTDPASRTPDENTLAGFIGLTKATVAIAMTVDLNNDGIADGGVDPCDIPNAEADEMVTGVNNAYFSFEALGGTIGSAYKLLFDAMCISLASSYGGAYDFCAVTDIATVTPANRQGVRGMSKETDDKFGLKAGGGNTATNANDGGGGCGT